ncbi:MAG: AraC family ligand binding domain-containing protein [Lachnospiraceae bacterium]|jgi:AraC-like DNA-binding protein|nr:AraC family ligand binding domain-containing protein [Lachnospiraceae bacterium]MBR5994498.1 AraC family ligand binding domain-containing protein [Lachnospiraceae bacterium]
MYKKQGYLTKEFKIFHIKDKTDKTFDFHYHDFYKIIVFIKGDVMYSIEGKNYELKPQDIVLVQKNEIHKPVINPEVEYERIVLYLSQSFLIKEPVFMECFNAEKETHTNVMSVSDIDFSKVKNALEQSVKYISSGEFAGELKGKCELMKALLVINESVHNNGLLFEGRVSYDKRILEVCDYIDNHIKEDLSVEALCNKFYISKYYFMHKFKEYTGVTVHSYILEKRIQHVGRLADAGWKVTAACAEAGFKDYSTYLRAKKRLSSRLVGAGDADKTEE